jgi:hypothetical protein
MVCFIFLRTKGFHNVDHTVDDIYTNMPYGDMGIRGCIDAYQFVNLLRAMVDQMDPAAMEIDQHSERVHHILEKICVRQCDTLFLKLTVVDEVTTAIEALVHETISLSNWSSLIEIKAILLSFAGRCGSVELMEIAIGGLDAVMKHCSPTQRIKVTHHVVDIIFSSEKKRVLPLDDTIAQQSISFVTKTLQNGNRDTRIAIFDTIIGAYYTIYSLQLVVFDRSSKKL